MSKTDFLPRRDGDLDAFEQNFISKLPAIAEVMQLDPAEVTRILTNINDHRTAYQNSVAKKADARAASENNTTHRKLSRMQMRKAAKMIKAHTNYTNSVGGELQIVGPERSGADLEVIKPELRTKVIGEEVYIRFKKYGTSGVRIYSRKNEETEFTILEQVIDSPYIDHRIKLIPGKPEQREYYAEYFMNLTTVGKRSDIVKVTIV